MRRPLCNSLVQNSFLGFPFETSLKLACIMGGPSLNFRRCAITWTRLFIRARAVSTACRHSAPRWRPPQADHSQHRHQPLPLPADRCRAGRRLSPRAGHLDTALTCGTGQRSTRSPAAHSHSLERAGADESGKSLAEVEEETLISTSKLSRPEAPERKPRLPRRTGL